jgi:DNA-binding HxlR family transcriptional regulator
MMFGYGQFCPIAKASEIFATRWTPLILRELMAGSHGFNDLLRGIPLISRAVLVTRLRELEEQGIIQRRPKSSEINQDYRLTPAGEAFRPLLQALGNWGLAYTKDRIELDDLDPSYLLWGLRRRADREALPERRVVVRFEFAGVPASRTMFRVMWLLLERAGVDICVKDPGFDADAVFRGNIRDFVLVYLGHRSWQEMEGKALLIDGDGRIAKRLPAWLRLDKVPGRDFPAIPPGQKQVIEESPDA